MEQGSESEDSNVHNRSQLRQADLRQFEINYEKAMTRLEKLVAKSISSLSDH